jgi:hypothetical protein
LITDVLAARFANLVAADVTTLDAALNVKILLSKSAFTPGPGTAVGSITEADFDGYAPLEKDAAAPNVYTDPATGDFIIEIPPPAGGFSFETTGVTNLPQTIFGWLLTDNAEAVVYDSQLMSPQPLLTASGQGFSLAPVRIRIPAGAIT